MSGELSSVAYKKESWKRYVLWEIVATLLIMTAIVWVRSIKQEFDSGMPEGYRFMVADERSEEKGVKTVYYVYDNKIIVEQAGLGEGDEKKPTLIYDGIDTSTLEYDEEDYKVEVERLCTYESTEYLGNYGAGIFKEKELLAMYADNHNFIYALTDGEGSINYVYLAFPSYSMDIDYEDYIPKDCLPINLDLSEDNPVRQEVLKEREKDLERHKEQVKNEILDEL